MMITLKIPYGSMTIHLDTFLEKANLKPIRDVFKLIQNPENWRDEKKNLLDIEVYLNEQIAVLKNHPGKSALLKKYEKLINNIRKIGGENS